MTTPKAPLVIETFTLGPFQTNCYLAQSEGEGWIIDASFEPAPMIQAARRLGVSLRALVLTHAHVDHIAGVAEVVRAFPGLPVWLHEAERDWLGDPELNLSAFMGVPVSMPGPDRLLHEGDRLSLGRTAWTVRHTPGHSPGGITLVGDAFETAFVGDALFAGSIGRTDFPGCSFDTLAHSIRSVLYALPDATTIYPGHGPTSTIGREKRSNPFVPA